MQCKCDTDDWQDVGLTRSKSYCRYQLYTSVTCKVRAMNDVGWGTTIEKTVYTKCTGMDLLYVISS